MAMGISPDQLYCGIPSVNGPNIPIALVHTYNINRTNTRTRKDEKKEKFVKFHSLEHSICKTKFFILEHIIQFQFRDYQLFGDELKRFVFGSFSMKRNNKIK